MNWLTIVLGSLIVLATLTGFAHGLVGMLVGVIGYVIALLFAGRYAPILRDWLQQTWHTTDRVAVALQGHLNLPPEAYQAPASTLTYERVLQMLQSMPLPQAYREAIARSFSAGSAPPDMSVAQLVLQKLAEGMMEAACFVGISVVVSYLLIWVARRISLGLNRLPLVGTVNRVLGGVVGLAEAAVSMSVMLGLLAPFLSMELFSGVQKAITGSSLAQWLLALYPVLSRGLFGRAWLFLGL